jgi:hypothetical protein
VRTTHTLAWLVHAHQSSPSIRQSNQVERSACCSPCCPRINRLETTVSETAPVETRTAPPPLLSPWRSPLQPRPPTVAAAAGAASMVVVLLLLAFLHLPVLCVCVRSVRHGDGAWLGSISTAAALLLMLLAKSSLQRRLLALALELLTSAKAPRQTIRPRARPLGTPRQQGHRCRIALRSMAAPARIFPSAARCAPTHTHTHTPSAIGYQVIHHSQLALLRFHASKSSSAPLHSASLQKPIGQSINPSIDQSPPSKLNLPTLIYSTSQSGPDSGRSVRAGPCPSRGTHTPRTPLRPCSPPKGERVDCV